MNLGEILEKSWNVYKRNFLALVVPFLTLGVAASIMVGLCIPEAHLWHADKTYVILGTKVTGTSVNNLNEDDEIYYKVQARENDRTYGLEIRHECRVPFSAKAIEKVSGIKVCLNFKLENRATCHFEFYNFSKSTWETLRSDIVGSTEVIWENSLTLNRENYIGTEEKVIRVRLRALKEENAYQLWEDFLIFGVVPKFERIATSLITTSLIFLLGLAFCCAMAIAISQKAMLGERTKLKEAAVIAGRDYPYVLVITIVIGLLMIGLSYFILNKVLIVMFVITVIPLIIFLGHSFMFFLSLIFMSSIGMLFILALTLFLCIYAWQGVVIYSFPPWKSIWASFKVSWKNPGATFVVGILIVPLWLLISLVFPLIGGSLIWLFFPLWIVALSLTYIDRTEGYSSKRSSESL